MPLYSEQPQQFNQQNPQAPQTPEGRKQKGTGFTNISNLLQANVGAGQAMGQALGGSLGQKAGQLKQDVTSAGQKFQEQYQTEKEKNLGQEGTIGGVSGYLSGQKDLSGLSSEEAQKIGEQLRASQYGGLQDLENKQSLLSRAGNLQALGTLAGMGGIGQGRLLQGTATRRGAYTRGQGLFDQYLLGQDVGAQEAIKQGATQTYGAAQQAQTQADIAAQQAQGLAKSIEAQKTEAQQNILKSLTGAQEAATQGAKQYLNQADRIKKILLKDIPPEQQTQEDKLALANLKQYGINPATVMTLDQGVLDNLINAIASSAPTAYTGQQRYTSDAQQKAAQNLALLSGQQDIAKQIEATKFDPNLFAGANKTIQAATEKQQQDTKALEDQLDLNNPRYSSLVGDKKAWVKDFVNKQQTGVNALSSGNRFGGGRDFVFQDEFQEYLSAPWSAPADSFIRKAFDFLGPNQYYAIRDAAEQNGGKGGRTPYEQNRYIDALGDAYKAKLAPYQTLNSRYQSEQSLQDYINAKFGINPQQGS